METPTRTLPPSIAAHLAAGSTLHVREDPIEMLTRSFAQHSEAVKSRLEGSDTAVTELEKKSGDLTARVTELEQKAAREPGEGGGADGRKSLGDLVAEDDRVAAMGSDFRGKASVRIDRKSITSANSTVGTGRSPATSLAPSERVPGIVTPAQRRLVCRDIFAVGETTASAVEYVKETGFINNAAMVAEGTQKPYSDITFDMLQAPVRTIAHLFKASRQILDDSPALAAYIEARGRYGLNLKEEAQLLFGDGTGQNLLGVMPQAKAYETSRTKTGQDDIDILLNAISQAAEADLPPSAVVVNTRDWYRFSGQKDAGGNYKFGFPMSGGRQLPEATLQTNRKLWELPTVVTNSISPGRFLVGAFDTGGAQIFDRMEVEVLVSTENADDFEKNMVSIRIEERLAFAVTRPEAFVTGLFPGAA